MGRRAAATGRAVRIPALLDRDPPSSPASAVRFAAAEAALKHRWEFKVELDDGSIEVQIDYDVVGPLPS